MALMTKFQNAEWHSFKPTNYFLTGLIKKTKKSRKMRSLSFPQRQTSSPHLKQKSVFNLTRLLQTLGFDISNINYYSKIRTFKEAKAKQLRFYFFTPNIKY